MPFPMDSEVGRVRTIFPRISLMPLSIINIENVHSLFFRNEKNKLSRIRHQAKIIF